jgi:hypothetical protein
MQHRWPPSVWVLKHWNGNWPAYSIILHVSCPLKFCFITQLTERKYGHEFNCPKSLDFFQIIWKQRIISLMQSSIIRQIWLHITELCLGGVLSGLYSHNISDFHFFRPGHHWKDIICRNAHLVHQNWYRVSCEFYCNMTKGVVCNYIVREKWWSFTWQCLILFKEVRSWHWD